ncbi:MAG: DNA-processing protein DprA [Dechloromonas sp.]|uniref:DNA-processing protein DprA n=1 Tax=Candidatus Dechloromonas phosphorivorans TaxID=2899244 RepID=A0A9D7LMT5_9RHOO|nr:DNA-processing protein DprA [Candidatus Dechloromonas phosphorivorans]
MPGHSPHGALSIISGLALGIDAAAHPGCVSRRWQTIAVIGTGADRIYPARQRISRWRLPNGGTIVSEFPLGTPAIAANFPRRNRIISGAFPRGVGCRSGPDSGSLITARLAAEQGERSSPFQARFIRRLHAAVTN